MISTLCSDMIVVIFADAHLSVRLLADGSPIPVLCLCDNMFEITTVLADIMTIQDFFCYVEGLRLAYVGPTHAVTNTYIAMLPRLGIRINYLCFCSNVSISDLY